MKEFARFIAGLLAPYKRAILWCSALAVLAAFLAMAGPIALGRGIDAARSGGSAMLVIAGLTAWLVLQRIGDMISNYVGRRGTVIATETISAFKLKTVDAMLRKPLSFHYGQRSGDLTEKISKFEDETSNVITGIIFDLIPSVLSVIAMLGYLAYIDWRISLLLGATVFGMVFYKYKTLPTALKFQSAWRAADRNVNSTAWDAIRYVLIVKSTTGEAAVADRLKVGRLEMLTKVEDDARFDERSFNWQNTIVNVGSTLVLLVALLNVRSGAFTFGQFTIVSTYTFGIFGYVRWVQWQMRSLTRGTSTYKDMRGLLEQPSEDYEGGKAVDLKGGIELQGVRFRYRDDVPVLEDVSFRVEPGERVAIVGESGEGKTTLVDLIGRYHLPQTGKMLYDGIDAKDVNLASLRSQIGLVPQDLPLLHESLGENIRFGRREATDEEVSQAAKLASLEAFITGLPEGFKTVVGERGLKLSGGQRQRVALARAFLRNPKILILDEPTSNLDSKTEEEIQRALETLMQGRTTFIIAHRLRTVRDADRILVLKGGRIVEQGKHDALVAKNGAYASLLRSQTGLVAPDETKEAKEEGEE